MLEKVNKFIAMLGTDGPAKAFQAGFMSIRASIKHSNRETSISAVQLGDGLKSTIVDGLDLPIPPDALMNSIGSPNRESYLGIAKVWGEMLSGHLNDNSTVLDIGSGCARIARSFVGLPQVKKYVGFDVIAENVKWCKQFVEPASKGKMSFQHFDIFSAEYNPKGKIKSTNVRFPLENNEADLVFAASVFTHLLERDCDHYLQETARVLKPKGGRAILSIHTSPQAGKSFSGNEARIDIAEEYFLKMAAKHDLKVHERMGMFHDQFLLVFSKI